MSATPALNTLATLVDHLSLDDLLDELRSTPPDCDDPDAPLSDEDRAVLRLTTLARLDEAAGVLRSLVADARAEVIAEVARRTTSRQAADLLGCSLAVVSRAMARARG